MPTKNFEQTIRFYEYRTTGGNPIWLPLVQATLITSDHRRIALSLMFDTGASVTTLRADLYYLLGLTSWNQGSPVQTATANAIATAYRYENITFEVFGKTITGPIHLIELPANPLYSGLLGRETLFNEFGFGFWESTHELLVTCNP